MKLVYVNNNRPITDSLVIAESFGKRHDNVLRDIKELECSEQFSLLNFEVTPYVHEQNGQTYLKYLITQDGFSFLVMGYTGKEAARFKEMYINEFNSMRNDLMNQINQPSYMIDDPINRAQKWIDEERNRQALEALNKVREEQLALQAPKVALYDTAMNAVNDMTMMHVAKALKIGRNKLFDFLREVKILMKNNLPYQEYIDRGYFNVRQYSITHFTTGIENKTQTLVTPKGMAYIHKALTEHGKSASA
jgi:anti-repressor protein